MVPLAPVRFSTTTDWPGAAASRPASRRAARSSAGPGGNGTTMVTGFAGRVCAAAGASVATTMKAATAALEAMWSVRMQRELKRVPQIVEVEGREAEHHAMMPRRQLEP